MTPPTRPMVHVPLELDSNRALPALVVGRKSGGNVERRHVLVVDDQDEVITVADPAGDGLVRLARKELTEARKLGARKGVLWLGHFCVR